MYRPSSRSQGLWRMCQPRRQVSRLLNISMLQSVLIVALSTGMTALSSPALMISHVLLELALSTLASTHTSLTPPARPALPTRSSTSIETANPPAFQPSPFRNSYPYFLAMDIEV